jgi:hypothetical protein
MRDSRRGPDSAEKLTLAPHSEWMAKAPGQHYPHDDLAAPVRRGLQGRSPVNRRAEMWMKSREWLEDPAGVQIPDMDSLQADACGPSYKTAIRVCSWRARTRCGPAACRALTSGTPLL